jgi:hypothetical protein
MEWWIESFEVIPDLAVEIHEIRDFGDGNLFVHGCLRGHGAGSGVPIERTLWEALKFRNGKVAWWSAFASEAEAVFGAVGPWK